MKMPSVEISFKEQAATAIKRGERGIVALILKEEQQLENVKNPFEVYSITDIPKNLKEENKEQIKLTLMGYVNAPKKVIGYVVQKTEDGTVDYNEALDYLLTTRFDYLVIPEIEKEKVEDIASWIKSCRTTHDKMVKAVLPNCKADSEGVINYTTEKVIKDEKEYFTEQYCSRIAGLIAGTPLTIASTFAPLNEVSDCTRLNKTNTDTAIEKGEFIVFWDGEKVKAGRGVNSLITTTQEKGSSFKKIKIVEAMDMIHDDIKKIAEDSYLGKYANSYDNKCLLISAIKGYFEQLELDGILNKDAQNTVGIDMEQQRIYLKSKGINVEELSEDQIKFYDTDDKVFLAGKIKILDAIEEIYLPITI